MTPPSSAARALFNGAPNIERADGLVRLIALQKGLHRPVIDANVALVDHRPGDESQESRVQSITDRAASDCLLSFDD